ncbi:hypothetical protein PMAYCL1PPCAC_09997, partial [Pristionchus mayeri]
SMIGVGYGHNHVGILTTADYRELATAIGGGDLQPTNTRKSSYKEGLLILALVLISGSLVTFAKGVQPIDKESAFCSTNMAILLTLVGFTTCVTIAIGSNRYVAEWLYACTGLVYIVSFLISFLFPADLPAVQTPARAITFVLTPPMFTMWWKNTKILAYERVKAARLSAQDHLHLLLSTVAAAAAAESSDAERSAAPAGTAPAARPASNRACSVSSSDQSSVDIPEHVTLDVPD